MVGPTAGKTTVECAALGQGRAIKRRRGLAGRGAPAGISWTQRAEGPRPPRRGGGAVGRVGCERLGQDDVAALHRWQPDPDERRHLRGGPQGRKSSGAVADRRVLVAGTILLSALDRPHESSLLRTPALGKPAGRASRGRSTGRGAGAAGDRC